MIRFKDVHYAYKGEDGGKDILKGVSLQINMGEFIGIKGDNGSGKSTLVKLFNGTFLPDKGEIDIDGIKLHKGFKDYNKLINLRKKCGVVFQNPDNQIISSTVLEDVKFGLKNIGLKEHEAAEKALKMLEYMKLQKKKNYPPNHLSGGEKQRLVIAGILVMEPDIIVLDEPTSMLDKKTSKEIIDLLNKICKEQKKTVVIVSHKAEDLRHCDRVLQVKDGVIVEDDIEAAANLEEVENKNLETVGMSEFTDSKLSSDSKTVYKEISDSDKNEATNAQNIEFRDVVFSYENSKGERIIGKEKPFNTLIKKGKVTAIVGDNGAGKSTLACLIAGLYKVKKGKILNNDNCRVVFQNPDYQLFEDSVLNEVMSGIRYLKRNKKKRFWEKNVESKTGENLSEKDLAKEALELVGVPKKYYDRSPLNLSGGEKKLVTIAAILAMKPDILILDEPTAGLSEKYCKRVYDIINELKKDNKTVILISHSEEEVEKLAEERILI
ncbi:MAG: ATP-binding cassette domain-containing protein [Lachnospiraceae bacterium]|nr:ATP-binding cassette domain-containing protein [Lachnospiraceae bacterium]